MTTDNPLHTSVPPSKSMGNPLMSPDGPGPEHGENHYSNGFAPKPDVPEAADTTDSPPDLPTAA